MILRALPGARPAVEAGARGGLKIIPTAAFRRTATRVQAFGGSCNRMTCAKRPLAPVLVLRTRPGRGRAPRLVVRAIFEKFSVSTVPS
jgi:hypothetical protein